MTNKEFFGKAGSEDVYICTLGNDNIQAEVISCGAALRSLKVRVKDGRMVDIIGGYEDIDGYINGVYKHGAMVGRCANRISCGRLCIDGNEYRLSLNSGEHHIHGGFTGYHRRVWQITEADSSHVTLHLTDADGTEGYPGTLEVFVTYRVTESSLILDMEAHTDKTTAVSLTNHCFFNLGGYDSGDIAGHVFRIDCDHRLAVDECNIPTGETVNNTDTVYDFHSGRTIDPNTSYDHCYYFGTGEMRFMSAAYSPDTGISMSVYSDLPAIQFFTVRGSKSTYPDKKGSTAGNCSWFCMEPQYAPDTPNHGNFVSNILRPGEKYKHRIEYKFKV